MTNKTRKPDYKRIDDKLSIISPLLPYIGKDDKESKANLRQLKREAAMSHGISVRTVNRYIDSYQKDKTRGLERKYPEARPEKLSAKIITRAIELKEQLPTRSIETIITILVQEKLAEEGEVKRTTLQDALARRGYTCKEIRLRHKSMFCSDRYEATKRNELWVTDIKYGPKIMYEGKEMQTYLSAVMDDHSRHIVFAKFYLSQGAPVVIDSLRHAVEENGVPEELYFDNGRMYRSDQVERFCKILGIQARHSPPYRAQARGKIERFFGFMNEFMDENEADPAETLTKLNERLGVWIDTRHEHHVNRTTHEEPKERYMKSRVNQRFVSKELIDYAAKCEVTRKVDNCGDISFKNRSFYVGTSYAHRVVSLIYDSSDPTILYFENSDGNIVEIRARITGRFVNNSNPTNTQQVKNNTHYLDNMVALAAGKEPEKAPETLFDLIDEDMPEPVAQTIRYYDEDEGDW